MTSHKKDNHKVLSAFLGIDVPDYGDILNCMHCGLCLPHCPTYSLTQLEKANPRGRIALIKAVADGDLEITEGFVNAMDFCLNCRACESACPAGVKYGELQEAARAQIEISGFGTPWGKAFKSFMLGTVFTTKWMLSAIGYSLWLYEKTGVQWLVRKSRVLELVVPKLAQMESLSPTVQVPFSDKVLPEVIKPETAPRYKVGLLTGCIMNMIFADVNQDTAEVLVHNGCQVHVPKDQVCCGSLHGHNGDLKTARKLAKKNIDVFEREGIDYLVINSAGCGSFLKTYGHLLREDKDYAEKARKFEKKVVDVSEFLVKVGFETPKYPINVRVTYDDACHLLHGQKISQQPRDVIHSIPGLKFVELQEASWCCGSAGIYNIVQYDASMEILDRKMENIKKTGAQVILSGNPGCLVQLRHGVKRHNMDVKVLHPITVLNKSYKNQDL